MLQQLSSLLSGISKVASTMTSLSGEINFQKSVDEKTGVLELKQQLNATLSRAVFGVATSVKLLEEYSFFWNTDPNTFLEKFLNYTW